MRRKPAAAPFASPAAVVNAAPAVVHAASAAAQAEANAAAFQAVGRKGKPLKMDRDNIKSFVVHSSWWLYVVRVVCFIVTSR